MIRPIILVGCLVKKDGKYLLVQEATDKLYAGVNIHTLGKWTIPHGRLDPAEKISVAAPRELLEETGGKSEIKHLAAIVTGTLKKTIRMINFVFWGKGWKPVKNRLSEEISQFAWFTPTEIKEFEKHSFNRNNFPLSRLIASVENKGEIKFINWDLPDYFEEVFERLDST